jgi:hypothetical protein
MSEKENDAYEDENIDELSEVETQDANVDERLIQLQINKELDKMDNIVCFDEVAKKDLRDSEKFRKGIDEALLLCGMYSAFINFGLSEDKAYELTISRQVSGFNMELAKENNNTSTQISKNQSVALEKTQL